MARIEKGKQKEASESVVHFQFAVSIHCMTFFFLARQGFSIFGAAITSRFRLHFCLLPSGEVAGIRLRIFVYALPLWLQNCPKS